MQRRDFVRSLPDSPGVRRGVILQPELADVSVRQLHNQPVAITATGASPRVLAALAVQTGQRRLRFSGRFVF